MSGSAFSMYRGWVPNRTAALYRADEGATMPMHGTVCADLT